MDVDGKSWENKIWGHWMKSFRNFSFARQRNLDCSQLIMVSSSDHETIEGYLTTNADYALGQGHNLE